MSTKEEFGEQMGRLVLAFNVKPSPSRTSIYWEELGDYAISRLQEAVRDAVRTCDFFPSVAELIRFMPPPKEAPLLSEPEPTEEEHIYGQWQCRFALWLMGYKKVGTKRVRRAHGQYDEKSVFQKRPGRWREAKTQEGRQTLWNKFCKEMGVPGVVASILIN